MLKVWSKQHNFREYLLKTYDFQSEQSLKAYLLNPPSFPLYFFRHFKLLFVSSPELKENCRNMIAWEWICGIMTKINYNCDEINSVTKSISFHPVAQKSFELVCGSLSLCCLKFPLKLSAKCKRIKFIVIREILERNSFGSFHKHGSLIGIRSPLTNSVTKRARNNFQE